MTEISQEEVRLHTY